MNLIELQDIQQCTDASSFQRGQDYFNQRMVQSLTVDDSVDDSIVLNSKVSGSKGEIYRQTIRLFDTGRNNLEINLHDEPASSTDVPCSIFDARISLSSAMISLPVELPLNLIHVGISKPALIISAIAPESLLKMLL